MMTKLPMAQLKLRSATGTAVLSDIKIFDDIGRVIYGGDGSKTANVVSTSWQLLSALIGDDWTNNLNNNGWGLQAVLSGQNLSISHAKGGDDPNDQDGSVKIFPPGATLLLGSVPEYLGQTAWGRERVALAWETGTEITGTLTNANDVVQGDCAGMASVFAETSTAASGPNVRFDFYVNGAWSQGVLAWRSSSSGTWSTSPSYTGLTAPFKLWAQVPAGATAFRIVMIGGGAGPHTIKATPSAQLWMPIAGITAGEALIRGQNSHDAAAVSGVVQMGAEARSTDGTPVQQGDVSRILCSLLGKGVVLPYALPGQDADGNVALSSTVAADVIAAPGAGIRLYITSITISSTAPSGTAVDIRFNTTTKRRIFMPANDFKEITFVKPLRLGANEALTAIATFASGAILVSASGYTAAE